MKLRCLLAAIALMVALPIAALADTEEAVFDTITGASVFNVVNNPRTYMGQAFNVDTGFTYATSGVTLTSMDTILVSSGAVNYTGGIRLRVQFWDISSNATSGTSQVFSSPVGGVQVFTFSPISFGPFQLVNFTGLTFASPISFTNRTNLGVTLNWQGDTGGGFVDTNNLSTAVRGGAGAPVFAAGTVPLSGPNFGYYRNVSTLTNFNFRGSDARQEGQNTALALRLNGLVVPETSACALTAIGLLPLAAVLARRRKTA